MRNQKEQVLNAIEIVKDNNRQWEIAKAREVESGMMTEERFNELRAANKEMTARHINHLESELSTLV